MKADRYVANCRDAVPVVRGNNISDTKELEGDLVFVSKETADELRSANVFPGDLIFPHRGLIGQVGIVPKNAWERYVLSTSLMKLTCHPELADPLFVFYFFRAPRGKHELLKHASQVGTPGIATPLTSLRSIRLMLPPLPEQRAIAHVLGTLDDKIELNRRTNQTLEAIARALFTSWFVAFDPVRAKAEGRQPAGMDAATAVLFPDEFEESEVGQLPKGWRSASFAQTVVIFGGGTPKTSRPDYWNGDIPWFSVVDAPHHGDVFVMDTEKKITAAGLENSAARLLPTGTTILSARGTVGRVALTAVEMTMNQSCYALRPRNHSSEIYTYYSTRSLVALLRQRSHGSVFDTITRSTLESVPVVVPEETVVHRFDEVVKPLLLRIKASLRESATLRILRDNLLPRLLSGELRVPDAERLVAQEPV
ncbi:MAG: restriction endonuclease subunit S [Chloroflexota bacterium]|nr:restriction endonuclease subunit S [Chloroflexota bacterium]